VLTLCWPLLKIGIDCLHWTDSKCTRDSLSFRFVKFLSRLSPGLLGPEALSLCSFPRSRLVNEFNGSADLTYGPSLLVAVIDRRRNRGGLTRSLATEVPAASLTTCKEFFPKGLSWSFSSSADRTERDFESVALSFSSLFELCSQRSSFLENPIVSHSVW
jgi:hypothetical protein